MNLYKGFCCLELVAPLDLGVYTFEGMQAYFTITKGNYKEYIA